MKNIFTKYLIAILMLFNTIVFAQDPPFLPPLPEPGTATIDGDAGEWVISPLGQDFFANMYEGFNNNEKDRIYSYLYLRYDCDNHIMYVLVYQATYDGDLVPLLVDGDHWVAIPDQSTKMLQNEDGNDGSPPDFAFIGVGYDGNPNHAQGWEGSFQINEVGMTTIIAHANIYRDDIQTSGTQTPSIDLNLNCGLLPVELTSFSVNIINDFAALNWETATEVNNYGFEIQRRSELEDWQKVGFVEGHGNSNSPKYYSFTDVSVTKKGTYSYRLKQIDIDGQFEYSKTLNVTLYIKDIIYKLNQNYPNPFNPQTTISFTLPEQTVVKLTIYNLFGEEVAKLVDEVRNPGTHNIIFNAETIASGIYYYIIETDTYVATKKLILLK